MGSSTWAKLLWGIKASKPKAKGGECSDEQYDIDERWEHLYSWWEEIDGEEKTGVVVEEIPYEHDGYGDDGTAGYYIYPEELSFKTRDGVPVKVNFPAFDEAAMMAKIKAACKLSGAKFTTPGWFLMTESH
jgi:hypothetical protein